MPIYTYECKNCGQTFELLTGVGKGEQEVRCKRCKSKNVVRTFSVFNIGSGSGSSSSPICPTGTCPTGTCDLG
jgi:putative FmdB family regulatory protein